MQALHKVLNMPEYSGICLNIVWRNCSDYGNVLNMLGQFYSVLNMPQVLNMPISKNGKVVNTQGLHWIWLSKPQYALMMPQYMWIPLAMLSMFAYAWKKQISEYAEILNGLRSQYKLPSSYRDKDVFRTLSNIYDGAFWEKNNAWMQGDRLKFFRIVTVLRN